MSAPGHALAAAKINLALIVGPRRPDGLHDVASVVQRVDLCDRLSIEPSSGLEVVGFPDDTIVEEALLLLAREAGVEAGWRVTIDKRIPVAAGLGGGSADAAAALLLANRALAAPLPLDRLATLAARLGSDVPFFLEPGPKLVEGAGERLTPVDIPQDYWVLLAIENGAEKASTGAVYGRFDELGGGGAFAERAADLTALLPSLRRAEDLARLPANDLAAAAGGPGLAVALREAGAFRADVSGAGPTVYGLFLHRDDALAAARRIRRKARTWVVAAVW